MKKTALLLSLLSVSAAAAAAAADYAVVVSSATGGDAGWAKVTAALKAKHQAEIIMADSPEKAAEALKKAQPRWVAFVAKPEEIDPEYVRSIHLVSRTMNDDPYGDFQWGIITGATADDATRLAEVKEPLTVKRALLTTGGVGTGSYSEYFSISDGSKGSWTMKEGDNVTKGNRKDDKVPMWQRFADYWNSHDVDVLYTSSHATQVNLEMPFSDGSLISAGDSLYVLDQPGMMKFVRTLSQGAKDGGLWFCSPGNEKLRQKWVDEAKPLQLASKKNTKVFVASGNCLIGDAMKAPDSMVVSWLSHQGVAQFVGYTIPTWYGKGGWGTSGLWHEGGGTLTLSEAFYLNNQRITLALSALAPELLKESLSNDATKVMTGEGGKMAPPECLLKVANIVNGLPKDKQKDAMGLIYDRDGVAFYGDPKWEARVDSATTKARATAAWTEKDGGYDVTVTAVKECKGGEALAFMLPKRLAKSELTAGADTKAVVTPDALLIPSPQIEAGKSLTLSIRPKK